MAKSEVSEHLMYTIHKSGYLRAVSRENNGQIAVVISDEFIRKIIIVKMISATKKDIELQADYEQRLLDLSVAMEMMAKSKKSSESDLVSLRSQISSMRVKSNLNFIDTENIPSEHGDSFDTIVEYNCDWIFPEVITVEFSTAKDEIVKTYVKQALSEIMCRDIIGEICKYCQSDMTDILNAVEPDYPRHFDVDGLCVICRG